MRTWRNKLCVAEDPVDPYVNDKLVEKLRHYWKE